MLYNCKAKLTISKVDNGFVLEWEKEKDRNTSKMRRRLGIDEDDSPFDPSGIEILTSEASLIKRLKELLG